MVLISVFPVEVSQMEMEPVEELPLEIPQMEELPVEIPQMEVVPVLGLESIVAQQNMSCC